MKYYELHITVDGIFTPEFDNMCRISGFTTAYVQKGPSQVLIVTGRDMKAPDLEYRGQEVIANLKDFDMQMIRKKLEAIVYDERYQ